MKISIITVTIGRIDQLKQALRSVAEQRYRDYEHLIMVDKKAPEGAYEAVKDLKGYPNTYLSPTRHDGIFDGWNKALKEIHGDIVMFLGDDDLVLGRNAFDLVIEKFKMHPDVKWVYGDYMLNGDIFKAGEYNYRRLIGFNFIGTMSTYFKKEIFEEYGEFDWKTYPHSADYEYSLRIGKKYPAVYLPVVISFFNWAPGSMSHDKNKVQQEETKAMQKLYLEKHHEDNGIPA